MEPGARACSAGAAGTVTAAHHEPLLRNTRGSPWCQSQANASQRSRAQQRHWPPARRTLVAPYRDAQPAGSPQCSGLSYPAPEVPPCWDHLSGLHFSGRREPARPGGAVGRVSVGPAGGCGLAGAGTPSLSLGAEPTSGPAAVTQVGSTAKAAREAAEALEQPDRSLSGLLLSVSKMLFVP